MSRRTSASVLLLALASACAYYNGMWSAEHLAKEARKLEARGSDLQARGLWAQAAVKAESVVARHPKSRWADAALVLQGEALVYSGACPAAAGPLEKASRTVGDPPLRARAALASAECALAAGDPGTADRVLAPALESADRARRSRADYLAGRAAAARGDLVGAAEHYGRSTEPGALAARLRTLLALDRSAEVVAGLDALAAERFVERDWASVLDALARAAGPEAASRALDRMLAHRRVPRGARARLLVADGDRLLAGGAVEPAAARYAAAIRLVPDSVEATRARLRHSLALATRAERPEDLAPTRDALARLAQTAAGDIGREARAYEQVLRRVMAPDSLEGPQFRAAELARDSLGAARLAGRLFVRFAERQPASLFAPKALLAALPLLPERRDSLLGVLDREYAASPYTLALHGEMSPAFGAVEDSLAGTLGVELVPAKAPVLLRVGPPVPGPRGPAADRP